MELLNLLLKRFPCCCPANSVRVLSNIDCFSVCNVELVVLQVRSPGELSYTYDANQIQRELISQLEAKNRYWIANYLVCFASSEWSLVSSDNDKH